MVIKRYHGGCHECYSQEKYDISRCNDCQYKKPDWHKDDLSIKKDEFIGDVELLESMDFSIIEKFVRQKKLNNIKNI